MIDSTKITPWLQRLVRIPSVTPAQGGDGEGKLMTEVARWFAQLGANVRTQEVLPGRTNVYGLWQGTGDVWMAVDVHMDTVGVDQMPGDPFDGRVESGRVYGRGAVDTKASLAVALALLEECQQNRAPLGNNLLIAATVDEEMGATGAPAFARWLQEQNIPVAQLAVAEPTGCVPVHGHKGVCRLTFDVRGRPAHSSQPEQGDNAILAAARIAIALEAEHHRLQSVPPTALGRGKLTIAQIHGGSGINVVPDRCSLSIDRRILDGEAPAGVSDDLYAIALEAADLPVEREVVRYVQAFLQSPETPWLRRLAAWSGAEPQVMPFGTNAWAYVDLDAECVVIGPGSIDQAHGADEWVAISQLETLAQIYARWWGLMD